MGEAQVRQCAPSWSRNVDQQQDGAAAQAAHGRGRRKISPSADRLLHGAAQVEAGASSLMRRSPRRAAPSNALEAARVSVSSAGPKRRAERLSGGGGLATSLMSSEGAARSRRASLLHACRRVGPAISPLDRARK
jgi:hypothetical protein